MMTEVPSGRIKRTWEPSSPTERAVVADLDRLLDENRIVSYYAWCDLSTKNQPQFTIIVGRESHPFLTLIETRRLILDVTAGKYDRQIASTVEAKEEDTDG